MANLFRRIAPAVLVGTAAVAVAASAGGAVVAEGGSAADGATAAAAPEPSSSSQDLIDQFLNGSSSSGSSSGSSGSTGSSSGSSGSSSGTSGSSSTSSDTSGSCSSGTEVTGPVANTQWGPVQVAATVVDGKVCAVRTLQTPSGDRKSVMINARAVPVLEKQVVAAGDASFDGVSGATVTSEGYRRSLQAILDQA